MRSLLSSYVQRRSGWLCVLILVFPSCHVQPEVRIEPENPPKFTFSRSTVADGLLVYHLKDDQAHKGILLDKLLADKENTWWMINGKHDNQIPITYGIVPIGMTATIEAKPLVEGEYYMVYVTSLVGTKFLVRNGRAEQIK